MPDKPPRRVLLIAFHYPPCATSSGIQRTLSFSKHLGSNGWQPVVLTAEAASYERTNPAQLRDIPQNVTVSRTFAPDVARHLAIRGRYWSRLAIPDRWRGWWFTAVPRALSLIREHSVEAIWSTYPIATAHTIAATVARLSGRPWVADFRDPMVEHIKETGETFPRDPAMRNARLKVEASTAKSAARIVFCTNGARRIFAERYPRLDSSRLEVISNGYDEQVFRDVDAARGTPDGAEPSRTGSRRRVLLHSGTIYPGTDRDPTALFEAIRSLSGAGLVTAENFELRLRDPSNEAHFRALAQRLGIEPLVNILPPLSYREALAEMMTTDALLLLQGYTSNPAIPAKLYEYLRARRPILGLVHPDGETAATLRSLSIDSLVPLTDAEPIRQLLERWLTDPAKLEAQLPSASGVTKFSREQLTVQLARVLDDAVSLGGKLKPANR